MAKKKEEKNVFLGKRKKAVAKACIKPGTGKIRINSVQLDFIQPRYRQMRIKEALIIAGESAKKFDVNVNVKGGGVWGQADAARTAIANALAYQDDSIRQADIDYDRTLLISDVRRTEPHKPSRSTAGPRRSKQQSKR